MTFLDQQRAAAQAEEDFFAEIRSRQPKFLTFTRPSRSGGPDHIVYLDAADKTPIDLERPCSCPAGADGKYCWAALQILSEEGAPNVAKIAAELIRERAKKDRRRQKVSQAQEAK